ncbi:putative protease Do-like 14 [Silene latifolia]|uniref:putative protease Do-like 14 n=1 Tax=Silene latifolia TaxID=37657 RepID=UPI003D782556
MGTLGKRSFDQVEESTIDVYKFSSSEVRRLRKACSRQPLFKSKKMNHNIDINTMKAALKTSPAVVSLVSFSGRVMLSQGSGTIIEALENNNIVMTSLNLIRQPLTDSNARFVKNSLAADLKIVVGSFEENSYIGEIVTYDFHYNILFIKFKSKTRLESAKLSMIDDDHSIKLKPGDPVIVVGRYFDRSFELMAAPGCFRKGRCDSSIYDCKELLLAGCHFTRCGDGAPLVNLSGKVIGLVYYEIGPIIPFLPINIVHKLWDHYKIYKYELRHPSFGFEGCNLYSSSLAKLDKLIRRFPSISDGVLIEKVHTGSCAESAGLCVDDIITSCDDKAVTSFLELWSFMWDKVGDTVKLEVVRVKKRTMESIHMVVGEAIPNDLNKWPRFDYM